MASILFFNRDKLTQRIQMQLSNNRKFFSQLYSRFSKSSWNFEYFAKLDDPRGLYISEIMDFERRG